MTTFWRVGNNYINPAHIVRVEIFAARPDSMFESDHTPSMRIVVNEPSSEGNNYVNVTGDAVKRLEEWLSAGCVYPADEPSDDERDGVFAREIDLDKRLMAKRAAERGPVWPDDAGSEP